MMNLAHALRFWSPADFCTRLAIVGAGGKSTTLFQLARQLAHRWETPVLVTTTTHLATHQLGLADRWFSISSPEEIARIGNQLTQGVMLVVGTESSENRVSGPDAACLQSLRDLADARQLPLLIEADGARLKPLKAPAEHEPAIPAFVDAVLVLSGLMGLGKPLDAEWVHRPERFAALSGMSPGDILQPDALARLLLHRQGGLKRIPPEARRVAVLNQADTPELRAQAQWLAQALLPTYHAVLVASLGTGGSVFTAYEPVAGIVLAAGASKRFGQPKQLLPWRGQPLVRHIAQTALRSGLSPVVVVTGADGAGVRAALQDLPVVVAENPEWEQGQSTSLRAGLRSLPSIVKGAVFLLADQPQVPATLVRQLVETHAMTLSPLAAPRVAGQRANPVLFDRSAFPALLALVGDTGGRLLFEDPVRYPVAWVDWPDEGILLDVDTDEDYRKLQSI